MKIICHRCRASKNLPTGHVTRSRRLGLNLYCGRKCAGLGRRTRKTKAQKVVEKRLYDMTYREKNRTLLKAKKRAYFERTYDPRKAAVVRKARMHLHVAYCRQPAYRVKKRAYDMKYRDSEYGPFAEAARLAIDLNREIKSRTSNYEIRLQNETLNKRQSRSRAGQEKARDPHSRAQG